MIPSVLFSIGAVVKNSVRMEADHFRFKLSRDAAERLFERHVELIEVETTSYCNRTCSFCPNSIIDRRSEKLIMPEEVWTGILDGLRAVDYAGTFVWSRYSEPLSERRILDRIKEVREVAPRTRICINSNGDFLDSEYLAALEEAGLNRLWIDVYIPDEETYDRMVAEKYHNQLLERIARTGHEISSSPELSFRIRSSRIEIVSHVRNVASLKAVDLSDRGGLIQIARQTSRVAPCYAPYKHLVIDWDGSVVICCQLRSDSSSHKAGVIGKIGSAGIDLVEAYVRLAGWRRALRYYGPKKGPCATCNVFEYDSNAVTRTLSGILGNTESPASILFRTTLRPVFGRSIRW